MKVFSAKSYIFADSRKFSPRNPIFSLIRESFLREILYFRRFAKVFSAKFYIFADLRKFSPRNPIFSPIRESFHLRKFRAILLYSIHVPSLSGSCSAALTVSLHIATTILEKPEIRSPSFTASSTRSLGGKTLLTSPESRAS